MKLLRNILIAALALVAAVSCTKDVSDKRDSGYGYAQFKVYKEASYPGTKAALDYLRDASKVMVKLRYGDITISQTLTLSYSDADAAEYGVRSKSIKLLTGNYEVETYTIFDNLDNEVYKGDNAGSFEVVEGGLTVHDLTADVTARGKAVFTFIKDKGLEVEHQTKAGASRVYTFDEIKKVDLVVKNILTNKKEEIKDLETKFSMHFDESDDKEDGYRTSSLSCSAEISLRAGSYVVDSYMIYDKEGDLLEALVLDKDSADGFEIFDNRTTEVDVTISMDLAAEYLKDYLALKEIWESLDGPNWYYYGEDWQNGINWDFNKSLDLWGDQPGVQLHSNGRVALINISDFGFRGNLSPAIGQLTELVELYLGSHNDNNIVEFDPTMQSGGGSKARMERHKEYLRMKYPANQMSEPIARALKEHGISIPEIALYDKYSEAEIMAMSKPEGIRLYDTKPGKLCNGLKSLPAEIGKLKKLERLYIANGELETLPAEFAELESLVELELYNCSKMTKCPEVFSSLSGKLEVLNMGNNLQFSEGEFEKIIESLSNAPCAKSLQILYLNNGNLRVLDGAAIKRFPKIGLLDLSSNKIEKITEAFGADCGPTQLLLQNNRLSSFPVDENGIFCCMDDIETINVSNNNFTEFPDIFDAESVYTMGSVDFSFNHISGVQNAGKGYKGLKVTTLTLNNNEELKMFPSAFMQSGSYVKNFALRGCSLEGFEENCLVGENSAGISSLDLSYNHLTKVTDEMIATNLPYLYGVDLSYNRINRFPFTPLDCADLTVYAVRGQRNANGDRCLSEWPTGIYKHKGLRGLYLGSNNFGKVDDTISTLCYYLDISDNPEIIFDASDICTAYARGQFFLIYDRTQQIRNCEYIVTE